MSLTIVEAREAVERLAEYDGVIDARSPGEYAEDFLPGALNWPVLDDGERRLVGTLYKQVSALHARKVGAALVARNVAQHIEQHVADKPREWRPLVYCWRGGQRSGSLAWFLSQIGFRTYQLAGGYKAFRAIVRDDLERLPEAFDFRVLAGRTGSGKTRLLQALRAQGAQVLDLEALACHRGSVLGGLPNQPQPPQKRFDTLLWQALRGLDPARPVFVESESQKVGNVRVPDALITRLREHGRCTVVEMSEAARVELLLQEYGFFAADPERFCRLIDGLVELRGHDTVHRWQGMARAGDWAEVFAELMREHYDPLYLRSMDRHFRHLAQAPRLELRDGGDESLQAAARELLAQP
ncbi:tRNA 2-selenouridine(34) synthase MnmH [Azohydromonas caseinilytica]|uniref:tRNA 2-selenouridine(34) synthase MnmH n=1 Tax=Azohydromonas caseinilytica TaxID=2728836 RepID=A0A848F860_9BURK|nr:tRNA 2-selenouridine(34) synthase MnmH [Azohydromonas caseinilytica]NML14523.1 tRNA 2-selenouridine(34) synthase MnmH [Azohydromonas caseinilytica]